ncbi:glycosyltransferase family 2 protein [Hymenobacter terrenus]|uniref:glycosyltransferase family 2 protein n=1 Tax=Hymenobacter terrenus TaxID=1629124 RepID=UPI000698EA87|nr:glycosyltransferase [Hymenobacter terrenus]
MRPYPPYHITHTYLDRELARPPAAGSNQGSYVVFWWQEIALGHLFISPGQELTETDYYAALLAAIKPAVQQYSALDASSSVWESWALPQGLVRWRAWMQATFATWLPAAVPAQVPVSAIICTRNRPVQLRRCLQQLRELRCVAAEILVVDNAPSDNRTQEATQEFEEVTYIREPRAGLDIARNTGIRAAHYPVVTFIDDDVVVHPMLLYRVWEAFEEPATAAITGLVIALELQTEAQLIFEKCWSFNRGYVDKWYGPEYMQAAATKAPPVWEIGAGANMAFRKSIFEQIGYFDELLDVGAAGCSGDSEMWYRILLHGHTIHYCPRAVVYHEHRKEIADLKRQIFYYMRGHAAAALIQQEQQPQAGYTRHLYRKMPQYYARLIKTGFPFFRFRSRTLWVEMKGLVSGIAFYYRNRNRAAKPQS